MKLIINNEKDMKKFYKLLPLYKSFLFNKIYFELAVDNNSLEKIFKALNIKNKKARLEYIYDQACVILDKQFQGINVCGFINNKCLTQHNCHKTNGCCRKCVYQSSRGCTTKNLTCKLFYCGEVTKKYNPLKFEDLNILKLLNIRQKIILKHDYFSSREEVLKDLEIGSLIIFTIRLSYRYLTKNIV